MAFTNFHYTTNVTNAISTPTGVCSAQRNSGTNGDLNALIHLALTSGSNWARTFNDGTNFYSTWAPSAGGAILHAHHNSAQSGLAGLAVVRGAESASGFNTLTDAFPQPAQLGDTLANWLASNTASTTSRDFHIVAWESGIIYATKYSGAIDTWEIGYFAKCPSRYGAGDATYPWLCGVRNIATASTTQLANQSAASVPTGGASAGKNYWMRNIQGTIKGELAGVSQPGPGATLGAVAALPAAAGGYGSSVDKRRLAVHANGSNTTINGSQPLIDRCAIPQLWVPLHSSYAGLGEGDLITEGSAQYILLKGGGGAVLLEITNTWPGYP